MTRTAIIPIAHSADFFGGGWVASGNGYEPSAAFGSSPNVSTTLRKTPRFTPRGQTKEANMQSNPTTSPTIQQAAEFKVDAAFVDAELIHLETFPDAPGDPLPPGVSAAQVSFRRDQRGEAIAWTSAVLRARWIMFRRAGPSRPPATEHLADDFCA
jgi:hypothetical protein